MNEIKEIAKAISETAGLGRDGIKVADKAATFFAKVFKEPINEVTGMITDKLRFVRWKRMVQMADEVNKMLVEKGVTSTRAVPPKIALPILEESSLEDDPTLQDLWNHLMANAMDPSFNDEVRYGFVEMIKNITAFEAIFLHGFYKNLGTESHLTPLSEVHNYSIKKEDIIKELQISPEQYALSANNLMRMQLLAPAVYKTTVIAPVNNPTSEIEGMAVRSEAGTIFKGTDAVALTPLGVKFVEACIK